MQTRGAKSGRSSTLSLGSRTRREYTRCRWFRSLSLFVIWRTFIFGYFFGFTLYHYGAFSTDPVSTVPLLFLPSVAEFMSLIYASYSLVFVISVGCRESGGLVFNKAMLGHRMVGIFYNIASVFSISSALLWVAFKYENFDALWGDTLKFHLYVMMPWILCWDLFVARYRVRIDQLFWNVAFFLIGYLVVFSAAIIVPHYLVNDMPANATAAPATASSQVSLDQMPAPTSPENLLDGYPLTDDMPITESSRKRAVMATNQEDMDKAKDFINNLDKDAIKALLDKGLFEVSGLGLKVAESKGFWEGLTGKEPYPYRKGVLEWKWDCEMEVHKSNGSVVTETIPQACPCNVDRKSCAEYRGISFNGVKKPLILGWLVIIGLFVTSALILRTIDFVREVLYRIYAFWRNTLCCVWCINWYNEYVDNKKGEEETAQYVATIGQHSSSESSLMEQIEQQCETSKKKRKKDAIQYDSETDENHGSSTPLIRGESTRNSANSILKKQTEKTKRTENRSETKISFHEELQMKSSDDREVMELTVNQPVGMFGNSPVESPVISIDHMEEDMYAGSIDSSVRFADQASPVSIQRYTPQEMAIAIASNSTIASVRIPSPEITVTATSQQEERAPVYQDRTTFGHSPTAEPPASPEKLSNVSLPMTLPTAINTQRSPSMTNYNQAPVIMVDGPYTFQSSGTAKFDLDIDYETIRRQHYANYTQQ